MTSFHRSLVTRGYLGIAESWLRALHIAARLGILALGTDGAIAAIVVALYKLDAGRLVQAGVSGTLLYDPKDPVPFQRLLPRYRRQWVLSWTDQSPATLFEDNFTVR